MNSLPEEIASCRHFATCPNLTAQSDGCCSSAEQLGQGALHSAANFTYFLQSRPLLHLLFNSQCLLHSLTIGLNSKDLSGGHIQRNYVQSKTLQNKVINMASVLDPVT